MTALPRRTLPPLPHVDAADRCLNLFRATADLLFERTGGLAPPERGEVGRRSRRPEEFTAFESARLDIDRAVDRYCREGGLAKPAEPEPLMEPHQQALTTWSNDLIEKEKP